SADALGIGDCALVVGWGKPSVLRRRDSEHHGLGEGHGRQRSRRPNHARDRTLAVLKSENGLNHACVQSRQNCLRNRGGERRSPPTGRTCHQEVPPCANSWPTWPMRKSFCGSSSNSASSAFWRSC